MLAFSGKSFEDLVRAHILILTSRRPTPFRFVAPLEHFTKRACDISAEPRSLIRCNIFPPKTARCIVGETAWCIIRELEQVEDELLITAIRNSVRYQARRFAPRLAEDELLREAFFAQSRTFQRQLFTGRGYRPPADLTPTNRLNHLTTYTRRCVARTAWKLVYGHQSRRHSQNKHREQNQTTSVVSSEIPDIPRVFSDEAIQEHVIDPFNAFNELEMREELRMAFDSLRTYVNKIPDEERRLKAIRRLEAILRNNLDIPAAARELGDVTPGALSHWWSDLLDRWRKAQ